MYYYTNHILSVMIVIRANKQKRWTQYYPAMEFTIVQPKAAAILHQRLELQQVLSAAGASPSTNRLQVFFGLPRIVVL